MIRVILVDDHLIFREGTRALLAAAEDITVVGACGRAEEALALVRDLRPDVIVLDIRLEGGSGIDVARCLHHEATMTKILILSAYSYETYVRNLFAVGVHGYLLKSTSGRALIDAVRALHRGEQVISSEITQRLAPNMARSDIARSRLTDRELLVLCHVRNGENNKEIADALHLSVRTVESYLSHAMAKLDARSRTEAINHAMRSGILEDE